MQHHVVSIVVCVVILILEIVLVTKKETKNVSSGTDRTPGIGKDNNSQGTGRSMWNGHPSKKS